MVILVVVVVTVIVVVILVLEVVVVIEIIIVVIVVVMKSLFDHFSRQCPPGVIFLQQTVSSTSFAAQVGHLCTCLTFCCASEQQI